MKNEILEIGDERWLVREALSLTHALDEIAMCRSFGSIGGRTERDETLCGGQIVVEADVVQLNSDGSERKPYEPVY